MNEQFTPELLASARTAETPEALLTLAAENGVTLTTEEAQAHFDRLHQTGELSDEELDNVAGGCGGSGDPQYTKEGYLKTNSSKTCDYFRCDKCGHNKTPGSADEGHFCPYKKGTSGNFCHQCAYFTFTHGMGHGYCKHPAKIRP